MAHDRADWSQHYAAGHGFRPLGPEEGELLTRHVPAPDGGQALDVGCGTGELAVFLTRLGYTVDAVDFARGALARARTERAGAEAVRWYEADIEHGPPAGLNAEGYDLITLRLVYAFLHDRTRVVRDLGARLRPGGALVVVTPVAAHTPRERRRIALDEEEIGLLVRGWQEAERFDVEGLAVLVLRGPVDTWTAAEKGRPEPHAALGACAVVTDACGRVLLGRSRHGMWELPGGRVEEGEAVTAAAVRELAEETGLTAAPGGARLLTFLHDDRDGVCRISAVVRVASWTGTLGLPEPHRFLRWEWHDPHAVANLDAVFAPSAQALEAVWPGVLPGLPPVHAYPHAGRHDGSTGTGMVARPGGGCRVGSEC